MFSYFGQLFVSVVKSTKAAMILAGVYIGFNNLFSGLIIRPQEMMGHCVGYSTRLCSLDKVDGPLLRSI